MNFVEQILLKLTGDRRCFLVVTSHIEKELNEITGTTQIMASTLGKKLAPKIPKFFSEVVYAKRHLAGTTVRFSWSTVDNQAELKNRALPVSVDLSPTFAPIVEAYRARVKRAGAGAGAGASSPAGASSTSPSTTGGPHARIA
jgi:hypothetical protein